MINRKIDFDSTNRLCLVIIDYNGKYSHLTIVSCYSKFATLLQANAVSAHLNLLHIVLNVCCDIVTKVKTQMKCLRMLHFIRVYIVGSDPDEMLHSKGAKLSTVTDKLPPLHCSDRDDSHARGIL